MQGQPLFALRLSFQGWTSITFALRWNLVIHMIYMEQNIAGGVLSYSCSSCRCEVGGSNGQPMLSKCLMIAPACEGHHRFTHCPLASWLVSERLFLWGHADISLISLIAAICKPLRLSSMSNIKIGDLSSALGRFEDNMSVVQLARPEGFHAPKTAEPPYLLLARIQSWWEEDPNVLETCVRHDANPECTLPPIKNTCFVHSLFAMLQMSRNSQWHLWMLRIKGSVPKHWASVGCPHVACCPVLVPPISTLGDRMREHCTPANGNKWTGGYSVKK